MFLNFNGEVREEGAMLLRADNRGFRYGDGLFETMLVRQGKVRLGQLHMDRLAAGMELLRLRLQRQISLSGLERQVAELCAVNGLGPENQVRARLTVFRADNGHYNGLGKEAWYFLEVSGLSGSGWREEGLVIDVFPFGRRPCDHFSQIKSNNYLLSSQAGMFARERGIDDCVLLNSYGRVAETTIANIWWVRDGRIYTPPLAEGCVAGVMRRRLLEALPSAGFKTGEEVITPGELAGADEIFVTNALKGIQWVQDFGGNKFDCGFARTIDQKIISKI